MAKKPPVQPTAKSDPKSAPSASSAGTGARAFEEGLEELEPRVLLSTLTLQDPDALTGEVVEQQVSAEELARLTTRDEETAALIAEDSTAEMRRELVFVDAGIDDYDRLLLDLFGEADGETRRVEVVMLTADRDGLDQIGEALAGRAELDAVHVIAHGSEGRVQLGSGALDTETFAAREEEIARWGTALAQDADLLFYGCDFAGSADGKTLVGALAETTGADVAASDDLTGAAALGGDWDLEYRVGEIDVAGIAEGTLSSGYAGVLATLSIDAPGTTQVVLEDATQTFTPLGGNPIVLQDASADDLVLRLTLAVEHGQLALSSLVGVDLVSQDHPGSVLIVDGAQSSLNAALEGLVYSPFEGYAGSDALSIELEVAADQVARYSFEIDGSDESHGVPNDGALVGDVAIVADPAGDPDRGDVLRFGPLGGALEIDGLFGDPPDVTLAAWVDLSAGRVNNEVISLGNSFALRVDDLAHGLTAYYYDGTTWEFVSAAGVDLDGAGWHHVATTFDDATGDFRLYLDGVEVASTTASGSIAYARDANTSGQTTIGFHGAGDPNFNFLGSIDEAQVFTRALSGEEIALLVSGADAVSTTVSIDVTSVNDAPTFDVGAGYQTVAQGGSQDSQDLVVQPDGKILVAGFTSTGSRDFQIVRYDADGSVDTGFGTNGIVTSDAGGAERGRTVSLLADGRILVTGTGDADGLAIVYLPDGTLDASFGTTGVARFDAGGLSTQIWDHVVAEDGSIFLAGNVDDGSGDDFALFKLTAAGALDPGFGGGDGYVLAGGANDDFGFALALQDDGKVVVAGRYTTSSWDVGLMRFDPDGSLDETFGTAGLVLTDATSNTESVTDVLIQPDGKIVVAGKGHPGARDDAMLVRYEADGSLDTSFGTNGVVVNFLPDMSTGQSLSLQPDGSLVLVGNVYPDLSSDVFVARFDGNGQLDPSFDDDGYTYFDTDGSTNFGESVAVLPDGSVLVASKSFVDSSYQHTLLKFTADGTLDSGFGPVANTVDATPTFVEDGPAIVLDADVEVRDEELDALNGGLGDYTGASLQLERSGGTNVDDAFGFFDGSGLSIVSGQIRKNGLVIASFDTTATPGRLSVVFTDASGETPTSADVDALLSQITYLNASDDPPGAVTLDWTFSDGNATDAQGPGGAAQVVGTQTVLIAAIDDLPSLDLDGDDSTGATLGGHRTSYFAGDDPVALADADATLEDPDDAVFSRGGIVSFRGFVDAGQEIITVAGEAFTVGTSHAAAQVVGSSQFLLSSDGTNLEIILVAGTGSAADWQTLLSGMTYEHAGTPTTGERSFILRVENSGGQASNVVESVIDVSANALPVFVNLTGGSITISEDDPPTILDPDASITDAELTAADDFEGATLTLQRSGASTPSSDVFSGTGTLSLLGGNVLVGATTIGTYMGGAGSLEIAFNANATNALVDEAIRQIAYQNTDQSPVATLDVDWIFNDGADAEIVGTTTVNITATPDAPTFDLDANDSSGAVGGDYRTVYVPGGAPVSIADGDTRLSDPDLSVFDRIVLTSFAGFVDAGQEILTIGGEAFTIGVPETATVSFSTTSFQVDYDGTDFQIDFLSGTNSTARWIPFIEGMTYQNTSPGTVGDRSFSITATDAGGDISNVVTSTITVSANGLPSFGGTLGGSLAITEGDPATVIDADVAIVDPQLTAADDFGGASLVLKRVGTAQSDDEFSGSGSLDLSGGIVTVGGTTIGTYTGGTGTLAITFDSNATNLLVDQAMQQITYRHLGDYPPSSLNLEWTFSDGNTGLQGAGGAGTVVATKTVTISPTDDPPISTDDSFTMNEDASRFLRHSDFGSYQDESTLQGVRISTLPAAGALEHWDGSDWIPVAAGETITRADLDANLLRYTPNAGETGSPYTTLEFEVFDGTSYSVATYTLTVHVSELDDAFLQGNYVEVGLSGDGTLVSEGVAPAGFESVGDQLGAESDPDRDGWAEYDGDFVEPGSPVENWGVSIGGTTYSNENSGSEDISGSFAPVQTSAEGQSVEWSGSQSGLDIRQLAMVGANDLFLEFEIQLTNTSGTELSDVYYFRDIDPDNDVDQGDPEGYYTHNTIVSQGHEDGVSMVTATQTGGSYFAIQAFGQNSRVTWGGFDNTDPVAIHEGMDGLSQSGSSYDDISVSVAYHFESIGDGETVTAKIRYYFGEPDGELPVVDLDANDDGGVGGADYATTYETAGGPVAISDDDGTILNPEGPALDAVTVTITNLPDGANEALLFDTTGTQIVANYDAGAGILTLTGLDSVANYNDVLRSVQYQNTAGTPDLTDRLITVTATSDGAVSEAAISTVSIVITNAAPEITSDGGGATAAISLSENTTLVTTITSSDVDGGSPSYSVVGGADAGRFQVDPATGVLAFRHAPDFESPLDADGDNVYEVIVEVADGNGGTDTQTIAVTIDPVNEAPRFGTSGFSVVTEGAGGYNQNADSLVLADGSILLTPYDENGDSTVLKLNPDGSVDTSFGNDGYFDDIGLNFIEAIFEQADGKIVVAGSGSGGVEIARFDADGSADATFGTNGVVRYDLGSSDSGVEIAQQADGKLLVSGTANSDAFVLRVETNGDLDFGFDTDGVRTFDLGGAWDRFKGLAIQSDGNILLAGGSQVVRLDANGANDPLFGASGIANLPFQPNALHLQPDGKIVVAGFGGNDAYVARLNADGSLDPTFGTAGVSTWLGAGLADASAYDLDLQSDGKIVLATNVSYQAGGITEWGAVRFDPDGTLDTDFGVDGAWLMPQGYDYSEAFSVSIYEEGGTEKILLGGYLYKESFADAAIVRLNLDGTLDASLQSGLLDGTPTYVEGAIPVVLDDRVAIYDPDLVGSTGFYDGASLTLERNGGGNAEDVFSGSGLLGPLVEGGPLVYDGSPLGTVVTNRDGTLSIEFGASARPDDVQGVLSSIAYSNTNDAPPASVQIDWLYDDGNEGAQGSGGALQATGSTTVSILATNDAPSLDSLGATFSLSPIGEDETNPAGDTVATIIANGGGDRITDADAGALEGIAVTFVNTTNGIWQFSTDDGGSWQTFVSPSSGNSTLLDASARIRFVPSGDWHGNAQISFRAWDQSDGHPSGTTGVSIAGSTGGSGAYSTSLGTAWATVQPANDDPILSTNPGGGTHYEGTSPTHVDFGATITDVDGLDFDGATLTATLTLNGTPDDRFVMIQEGTGAGQLEVSGSDLRVDGVVVGSFAGGVGAGDPFVVTFNAQADAGIVTQVARYVGFQVLGDDPSGLQRQITLQVTDGDGGTSAAGIRVVNVIPQNDAPVLDGTAILSMPAVEDAGPPSGPVGSLVSSFVDFAGGGGYDNVTDADGGAQLGIAVTRALDSLGTWHYSTDDGTTWNLVGSVSDGNALLLDAGDRLYFEPDPDRNGTWANPLNFRAWDLTTGLAGTKVDASTNGGTTAFSSAIEYVSVQLAPVNDAPVLDLDADDSSGGATGNHIQDFREGDAPVRVVDTDVSISDIDSATLQSMELVGAFSGSVDGGFERYAIGGETFQIGLAGSATTTLGGTTFSLSFTGTALSVGIDSGTGSIADFEALLATMTYQHVGEDPTPGLRSFLLTVTDASGGVSNTVVSTIDVFAENDAPTVTLGTIPVDFTEQSPVGIDTDLVIGDVDGDSLEGATVRFVAGYEIGVDGLNWTPASGIASDWNATTGTLTFTGTGTLAEYQALLRTVSFYNGSDTPDPTTRTIEVVVDDGTDASIPATRDIEISPVNDLPTVDLSGADDPSLDFAVAYTEGSGGQFVVDADAFVSDPDSTGYLHLDLDLSGFSDMGEERIWINGNAFDWNVASLQTTVVNGTTFELDFDGEGFDVSNQTGGTVPQADLIGLIRSVGYEHTGGDPTVGARTFSFSVLDAEGDRSALAAISTVTVQAVDDAPILDLDADDSTGGATGNHIATFREGDPRVAVIDTDVSIVDPDSETLLGANGVGSFTGSVDGGFERYQLNGETFVIGTARSVVTTLGGTTFSIDFTGSALAVSVDSGSGSVADFEALLATMTYQHLGEDPTEGLRSFSLAVIDDTGEVSNTVTSVVNVLAENDAPVLGPNALTIEEGESVVLTTADLAATDFEAATGSLEFSVSGLSGGHFAQTSDPGTPIGSFIQQQVIDGEILFVHDGGETPPTYAITVSDGALSDGPHTATISFTARNDLPIVTPSGPISIVEDTTGSLSLSVADPDIGIGEFSVGLSVSNGTLTLATTAGLTFSVGDGAGDASMTFTGSEADVNAALADLEYRPTSDFSGSDSLVYGVSDQGGSGIGGPGGAIGTISIDVSPRNDRPELDLDPGDATAANGDFATFFESGSGPVGIVAADARLIDVDSPTLVELAVTITNLMDPGAELLAADTTGTGLTSSYDASSGVLTISGAGSPADYEQVLRTITYQNTAHSPDPSTRSVIFLADDGFDASVVVQSEIEIRELPPVAVDDTGAVAEGGSVLLDLAGNDQDPEGALDPTSIVITSGPASGTLTLLGDGRVRYDHDGSETTADSFQYTIRDTTGRTALAASVVLTIDPVNDAPRIQSHLHLGSEDSPLTISSAVGVLDGASDVDSPTGSLVANLVSPPASAEHFVLRADGSFEYTPRADWNGTDTFLYTVSDGETTSEIASVTLQIASMNDDPYLLRNEGVALGAAPMRQLDSTMLAAADVDDVAASLLYRVTGAPERGTLYLASDPGAAISQFTQADLDAGRVHYRLSSSVTTFARDAFLFVVEDPSGAALAETSFELSFQVFDPDDIPPTGDPGPEDETPPIGDSPEEEEIPTKEDPTSENDDPAPETPAGTPPVVFVETRTGVALEPALDRTPPAPEGETRTRTLFTTDGDRRDGTTIAHGTRNEAIDLIGVEHRIASVLEAIRDDFQEGFDEAELDVAVWVARSESVVLALGLGLVAQILRSGSLVALSAASVPLWRGFDPVSVLASTSDGRRKRDEEIRFAERLEDETDRVGRVLDDEPDES